MLALVLSGGGMFGAYQAGVWSGLERTLRPELVVGCSVGALNGWAIAGGSTGEELERKWLSLEPFSRLSWRLPRSIRGGILDPAGIEHEARSLYNTWTPRIPIGVTLLTLPRMTPRLVANEHIGWRHLAASCAIPAVLPPYLLDGSYLGDDGIRDALPLAAAVRMGATRILAVHLIPSLPWPLRAARGILRAVSGSRKETSPEVPVLTIRPGEPLGSLGDAAVWRRENALRWIQQGRRAAEECEPMLPAFAAQTIE